MWAAAAVVLAASGPLEGAAAPLEAHADELEEAAAGVACRAGVVGAALGGSTWRRDRGRRRWGAGGRVGALLDRVRGFDCNSTQAGFRLNVPLHPEVALLPPGTAPRVPHNPIVQPVFGSIPDHIHTVVQVQATLPCEYTLKRDSQQIYISILHSLVFHFTKRRKLHVQENKQV